MQKMRNQRFSGNRISNYKAQMITGGARRDLMIWWCKQHHGIQHLFEMLTFEINIDKHQNINFMEIHFYLFFRKNFEIFADWLKNKAAEQSLSTPEIKLQG